MTNRANQQLDRLKHVGVIHRADVLVDLVALGLDAVEIGWVVHHLFGVPMGEAVHLAEVLLQHQGGPPHSETDAQDEEVGGTSASGEEQVHGNLGEGPDSTTLDRLDPILVLSGFGTRPR